ncbi:hypothetical protein [Raineyella fluvialis]|uniref:hypothetical protein n=1 Tax=Raineyella fluvialis TaxID=2662261 RepID=UPI00188F396D|nr:hypothetical protein [Raineyella fluvialis]
MMGFITSFVAPLTLITSLLFYFGYVSSREYFRYFGVDVDLLGLSPREFVMRSPGALFVPVMILLLLAAALSMAHRLLRRRLRSAAAPRQHRVVTVIGVAGAILLLAGLTLAFLFPVLGTWPFYPFVTPLVLAVGAGLAAYAAAIARTLSGAREGRTLVVLLVLVLVAGTFWTAATVAQWWGLGQARALAADFSTLPAVVLDTQERLSPGNNAISLQQLPVDDPAQGGSATTTKYHYRYFGLRLLVYGGGRLYLVPDNWSPDASTIVVPYDDSVRLRFRFAPDINSPR